MELVPVLERVRLRDPRRLCSAIRRVPGADRELGGQGLRDDALSRPVPALDQAGAERSHGLRGGDRRQAHPDQRPRGSLCEPGANPGQCRRRQGAGDGGGGRSGHRLGGSSARRSDVFRHASGGHARQPAAADQGRGAGLRFPNGRHVAVHHQGHRFADRVRVLQLSQFRAAHPGGRSDQSGQQRRVRRSPATR